MGPTRSSSMPSSSPIGGGSSRGRHWRCGTIEMGAILSKIAAGLSPKDVRRIFADLGASWGDAQAHYDEWSRAPDLAFADFLRWCMSHWPALPLTWALDFFAF